MASPNIEERPRRRAVLLAAALGAALFGLAIAEHGRLGAHHGCVVPISAPLLNLPARLVVTIVPNRVLTPVTYGEIDPARVDLPARRAAWSPALFVVTGLVFYAALGVLLGWSLPVLRRAVRRSRAASSSSSSSSP